MHFVLRAKMASHPLDPKVVGDLRALYEDVSADASELGGVEDRLELCRYEGARGIRLELLLWDIELVAHERLWRSCPFRSLVEIFFNKLSVRPIKDQDTADEGNFQRHEGKG